MYLPIASSDSSATNKPLFGSGSFIPRRYCKLVVYALFTGGLFAGLALWVRAPEKLAIVAAKILQPNSRGGPGNGADSSEPKWEIPENPPPDYADYRLNETKYPQHNPDLPFPEGRTGKYVYFSGHITGVLSRLFVPCAVWVTQQTSEAGWGNALQEHFFQGLLAYVSGRSYVSTCYLLHPRP